MPRKLQPCGTSAAYARHRYNNEEPCVACKQANSARANDAPSGSNAEGARAYAALEANPPVIAWRKKSNGVWVAASVYDPHAETSAQAQAERLRYAAQLALEEEARENAAQYERDRAEYERRRRENTSLMQAARTHL